MEESNRALQVGIIPQSCRSVPRYDAEGEGLCDVYMNTRTMSVRCRSGTIYASLTGRLDSTSWKWNMTDRKSDFAVWGAGVRGWGVYEPNTWTEYSVQGSGIDA